MAICLWWGVAISQKPFWTLIFAIRLIQMFLDFLHALPSVIKRRFSQKPHKLQMWQLHRWCAKWLQILIQRHLQSLFVIQIYQDFLDLIQITNCLYFCCNKCTKWLIWVNANYSKSLLLMKQRCKPVIMVIQTNLDPWDCKDILKNDFLDVATWPHKHIATNWEQSVE